MTLVLVLLLAAYFVPTLVASMRSLPRSSVAAVGALNVGLGWTGIGWVVALAYAVATPRPRPARYSSALFEEAAFARRQEDRRRLAEEAVRAEARRRFAAAQQQHLPSVIDARSEVVGAD